MHRLGRTDTLFLDLESENCPLHTLKVGLVRRPDGFNPESLGTFFGERFSRWPQFTWKLSELPGGLHRPAWVEDPSFDVRNHIRYVEAPAPGGMRELCEVVSRAAEAPLLDRRRPMWEAWIVGGLEDGMLATVVRMHHALADGVSTGRMLASVFNDGPTPALPGFAPSPIEFASRALQDEGEAYVTGTPAFLRALGKTLAARELPLGPPVPKSRFSRTIGPNRSFACVSLDLADLLAVKKKARVTLNDAFLALVAGALRNVLGGELPEDPLVAGIPVSRLPVEEQGAYGNRGLTTMYARLPTNVEGAAERLQSAHAGAVEAKEHLARTAGARIDDALALAPRLAARALRPVLERVASMLPLGGSVTVSNVRGPERQMVSNTYGPIENFFSIGPCAPGCALNVTGWSYAGRFNVSVLSDPTAIDAWTVLDAVQAELHVLLEA